MAEIGEPNKPDSAAPSAVASVVRSVFISYASEDVAVADKVCSALEAAGFPCWIAPRDVRAGEPYAAAIVEAINACRLMVLVLTKSAIHSRHVFREIERASSKDHQVLSIRMDATELPPELEYFLSADQWLDASGGPVERIFPALVESVRGREAGKTAGSEGQPPGTAGTLRASGSRADTQAPHTSEHGHGLPFKMPFLEQLKRRNVVRVAILYVAVCYLILEPFSTFLHVLALPEWTGRTLVLPMVLGFPATVIFAWVFEMTPEGLKPTAEVDPKRSIRRLTGRRLDFAIIIVLVLALGYFAADKFWLSKRSAMESATAPVATATSAAAPTAPTLSEKSIAVLPFTDMSEKHDQEYFGDGMAEEILDLLVKIPGLTVIGRTSSFQFKGKNEDLRTIGAKLNAAYVLEGSVRRSGEQVRITAQLINTRTGTHEWSETYDRHIGDVLKLQDAIAAAVVRELQLTVAPGYMNSRSTVKNGEVYDLILRGRHAFDRFDQQGFDEAVTLFRQALDHDPTSGDAAAELANTYESQGEWGFLAPAVAFEQARRAAATALKLDPKNVRAHTVLGDIHLVYDWDWAAAAQEYQQVATLAPGSAEAQNDEAWLLVALGRWDDALRQITAALSQDPLDPDSLVNLTYVQMRRGHLPEAEAAMRRALDIRPTYGIGHFILGLVLLERGDRDAALREMQHETVDEGKQEGLAIVYYSLGRKTESDASLVRMLKEQAAANAFGIANVYAFRGQSDEAMHWLERAYVQKDASLYQVKSYLPLKGLAEDPRFKAFLRKMNLPVRDDVAD
jgi:adenylate cyclase